VHESRRSSSPISSSAPQLILASRSPQRRAILEQLGVSYEVRPVDVEERTEGPPDAVASWNANSKMAAALAAGHDGKTPILTVDTVVALDGALYGKPASEEEARATLSALSGRTHTVVSAITLWRDDRVRGAAVFTDVDFRRLDAATLEWYLASGEWRERAGGYAIQGRGSALVWAIKGDYLNVVGLPVVALLEIWPTLIL
jgi:nucleoside triphosphate pyrophosphatase